MAEDQELFFADTRRTLSSSIAGVAIDRANGVRLQRQVYAALRHAIVEGRLRAGARLPSTRDLAVELGVSRKVVIGAFERLVTEGFLRSCVGSGTYVSDNARKRPADPRASRYVAMSRWGRAMESMRVEYRIAPFAPGAADSSAFPRDRWIQLLTRWWKKAPSFPTTAEALQGMEPLRAAIADHVATMRGIICTADDVVITAGHLQSIDAVLRLLSDAGDSVVLEDPCDPAVRGICAAIGLERIAAQVDAEGLRLPSSFDPQPKLAIVTPAAHVPLGIPMATSRRFQLLDWAGRSGAVVIESDPDCGLAESTASPQALKASDHSGSVVYVGSFSRSLSPDLSVGFVIAPPSIVPSLARAVHVSGRTPSTAEQLALADFISRGEFARHVRRMRSVYDERHAALAAALEPHLGDGLFAREERGGMLHSVVWLDRWLSDTALSTLAAEEQLIAPPLASYAVSSEFPPALILGFGSVPEAEIGEGIVALADAARRLGRTPRPLVGV